MMFSESFDKKIEFSGVFSLSVVVQLFINVQTSIHVNPQALEEKIKNCEEKTPNSMTKLMMQT